VTADLLYSDVEEQLRASVRDLLATRAPLAAAVARTESREPYDGSLWRALATEIGITGLAFPEEDGGQGASWREVAVVAEELGATVAATPFLGHTMATVATATVGAGDLLGTLLTGKRTATLAVRAGGPRPSDVAVDGGTITGHVTGVADALTADVIVVPTPHGLHQVEASDVARTPVPSLDMTRPLCDLTFERTPATQLAEPRGGGRDRALLVGRALLASEQLGLAQRCLDMTVAYLKERYQFGRPIGSFQALKHRAADLWAAITQARAVARYAAACVADDDADSPVAVALAQAYCGPVAVRAAEECVQLHGGIGFTWEHPAHLYLKRAKADAILLGTPGAHRARLAELVGLFA
jgi:alkylation response protein AidB-like acyl-CoA dehydrogenase